MFAIISIWSIVIVLGLVVVHWFACPVGDKRDLSFGGLVRFKVHVLTMFFLGQKLSLVGKLKKLVYMVTLLCFLILFLTGFVPRLICGVPLSGYTLMIHATFAPVFAVCAMIAIVGYAQQCRFTREELDWVVRLTTCKWKGLLCNSALGGKLTFWLGAILILPVALSMISSMYPIFGTHGQEILFELHRYCALVLVLVAICHVYLVMRAKFKVD
ncbi:MAG: hypothetical protein JXA82_13820 [Sedimentisphaerales bacterium]|nr:hypothetical protein [Sedimentisphaerales bacterium]